MLDRSPTRWCEPIPEMNGPSMASTDPRDCESQTVATGGLTSDRELRLLLAFTRRLPRVRGAVRLAMTARRFYLRRERPIVEADVLGFRMTLDPADWVQSGLLFW